MLIQPKNRTMFDMFLVVILSIFFAVMSLCIHFIEGVYDYFYERSILEYAEFFANFVFLYMIGLIWFTLKRWRMAEGERRELENVVSSINNDILIVSDRKGNITMCNGSAERMLGYKADEVLKMKTDFVFYDKKAYPERWREMYEKLEKEGFCVELATGKRKDGTPVPLEIITWNLAGGQGAVQLLRDITERKQMEEKLKSLSIMDELTGLYNRRGFFTLTERQMKLSQRTKHGMLLVFVDLDRMKWINDTLGHKEGDRALMDTADIFRNTFRTTDIIARIGGDEFAVVAVEALKESVDIIIDRIQTNVESCNSTQGRGYTLSLSIGITYYDPEQPCSIDELLNRADALMYEHKRSKQSNVASDESTIYA